jgi:UrcA family protein
MFRCTRLAIFAVVVITMLGHAAGSKASDVVAASEVKYDVIGKVAVKLKDLNLQTPADAQVLLERLDQAAYQACGGNPKFHSTYATTPERTLAVFRECREAAVRRAVDQIDNSTLTRSYADSLKSDHPIASADSRHMR